MYLISPFLPFCSPFEKNNPIDYKKNKELQIIKYCCTLWNYLIFGTNWNNISGDTTILVCTSYTCSNITLNFSKPKFYSLHRYSLHHHATKINPIVTGNLITAQQIQGRPFEWEPGSQGLIGIRGSFHQHRLDNFRVAYNRVRRSFRTDGTLSFPFCEIVIFLSILTH